MPYEENPAEFYFGADAFFLSSREDPFPSVVLEAMSAGLPVVGLSGASGVEELVSEHGWLVDRHDLESGRSSHSTMRPAKTTRVRGRRGHVL